MRKIEVTVDGKAYSVPVFTTAKDVLKKAGLIPEKIQRYDDNPPVGVLMNGELKPLGVCIPMSCDLETVRVFQGFGRRIYRHSICYLLCYAVRQVLPDRNLVIGHSLGDGFYFDFKDGKRVTEKEVEDISACMRKLVSKALDIEYVTLSNKDAIKALGKQGYEDAVMLIRSMNRPYIDMYKIGDYYHVAYEPIVDNTRVMEHWELRKYSGSGMLLRYPVKDNILTVSPFKDNDKLFEVFSEYRTWGKILGVTCVGEMNGRIADNTVEQYVRLSESLQRRKIASIADDILKRGAKAVFIAGPSSSGKTTFAKELCEQLLLKEYAPIRISLDDYYKKPEFYPLDDEGKPDLETIDALNIDMFESNMKDLFSGKEVDLPHFSFKMKDTYYLNSPIRMYDHTIFVIEGLHGLNPKITSRIDRKLVYKVYISALTQLNMDDCNRVSTTDDRMLRRILRDHMTRNTSAEETLLMWPSVSRGERIHIFPHQNNADVMFNSALDYEIGVLSPFVTPLLHGVRPESGEAYTHAQRLLEFLENIHPIPSDLVPGDSLLREFIGGSDFEGE